MYFNEAIETLKQFIPQIYIFSLYLESNNYNQAHINMHLSGPHLRGACSWKLVKKSFFIFLSNLNLLLFIFKNLKTKWQNSQQKLVKCTKHFASFYNKNSNQNSLESFFSCLFFSDLDKKIVIFQPICTILVSLERGDPKLKVVLNWLEFSFRDFFRKKIKKVKKMNFVFLGVLKQK